MHDLGHTAQFGPSPGLDEDHARLKRIHAGPRHVLYRDTSPDVPIVVKVNATPDGSAAASLKQEYELLRDLALPGIVRVLGLVETGSGIGLAMEDLGGHDLAQAVRPAPFSITLFLDIAVQLTQALLHLHEARIVHRDIHPGNIIWNQKTGVATLCDFSLARSLPLHPGSANPPALEGTLAYMSPEQTGRTGRSTDERADLYSLGATFYWMLTGSPPFAEVDPLALAHAQIARVPRPADELDARVPPVLARIVARLLEKEPADRYQSAAALAEDLGEAKRQWLQSGMIRSFPLDVHEIGRGLTIPDRLYGRDAELQVLDAAFRRACAGGRELVLVTGGPGIGKSALVERLAPSVNDVHGYYAVGKFDQLQRSVPFSGLAQALRGLVRQLLTESEAALEGWRERINDAVAPNGQLLLSIVPELERILGPQSEVPEVGPVEARNRFQLLITRFLRVFASPEHPFVLFLDDLQWVDAASLQLIVQCASDPAGRYLMIVGAYRDGEVGPSHALTLALAALRDAGCEIHTIPLEPLQVDAVAQLAAGAFGEDAERLDVLAGLLIRKSAGNPFFVRRLLHLMHVQGLVRFDAQARRWSWDAASIERTPISDNVLDVMVLAIGRLPPQARRLLEIGACIGYRFDLGTLSELTDLAPSALIEQLGPAIADGLLLQPRDAPGMPDADAPSTLQFAHDRVQQAAYGLLGDADRQLLHYSIGRRLLDRSGAHLDEKLFEIVDQFKLGEARLVDAAERAALAELNLAAGRKAKESAAYRAAFDYLSVARRLLGAQAWADRPDLSFTVHCELAESAYLAGEHAVAEEAIETSLEHAPSKVAQAELYGLRVLAATVASDWERALHWGREGLRVFGQEWPQEGLPDAILAEVGAVMENLGTRDIESLIEAPDVQDADIRASMRLLSLLGAPAYFSGAPVMTFILSRAVNLSIVHGPSPYSAFAYVLYGGTHNALTGQYDVGYAFGKLALALAQRFGNRAEECRTVEVYGVLVHHWRAPLRSGLPLLKEGFRAGIDSGEFPFAAFNLNSVLINALPAGLPLGELLDEAEVALDFATTQKNRTSVEIALPFRQFARALTGATPRPDSFEDEGFDETRFLADAANHATALGHYWVTRLQLAYLMGDHEQALMCSGEAEKRIAAGIVGMITSAEHVLYTALALAATVPATATAQRPSSLARLRELHSRMADWARHCPENFSHKLSLLGAEIARVEGRGAEASALYRSAIAAAERHGFVQDEALAHELRARHLLGEHEPAFARVHLRLALDRYRQWGATEKLRALEAEFPHTVRTEAAGARTANSIDHMALIKASQAISSETTPERLFEQILRVVLKVAGAQRGALALASDGALTVHAQIDADGEVSLSLAPLPMEQCAQLPPTILRYVQRTKEFLLLSDAGAAGLFTRDPAVRQRQVRSVLCIPLLKQSSLMGLIYLENNAMAGAFAADLVEVGKVLAAQAVISLENSNLLDRMQQLTGELEARVADRTRQLTDEILARDKAEMGLKIAEARQALLLRLSDALRPLTDPDAIRRTAVRLLGEHAGFARTYYFKLARDADGLWVQQIEHMHATDAALPGPTGSCTLGDVGDALAAGLARGEPLAIADVEAAPGLNPALRAAYRALGAAAVVDLPATSDGGSVAGIGAHDSAAHAWTTEELDLIREVAARTLIAAERARAEAALREADRQKDDFLAMLAHELRNPLASISNASELMARTGAGGARTDALSALLKRQTRQLTRLVDDLLDLSRISRGRITLEKTTIEIGELVQQGVETVHNLVQEKEHRLVVSKPAHSLYVDGDRTRLVQAISNLIHNAAKYTDKGGEIHLEIFDSQEEVGIRIRDNGVGIPPEILPSLFDLFVQSERTLDRSQGGLGIGLSVVKRLIDMHHGSVQAASKGIGQGATFTIRLPRVIPPAAQLQAGAPDSGLRPKRILIVDDNIDAADSLAMLLEFDGHQVSTVYGALEALEAAARLAPDMLFLDIGLPVMDGYEVARRLRSQDATSALRLVAITGYGQKEDRERALASGFDDHLTKPVTPESLDALLKAY